MKEEVVVEVSQNSIWMLSYGNIFIIIIIGVAPNKVLSLFRTKLILLTFSEGHWDGLINGEEVKELSGDRSNFLLFWQQLLLESGASMHNCNLCLWEESLHIYCRPQGECCYNTLGSSLHGIEGGVARDLQLEIHPLIDLQTYPCARALRHKEMYSITSVMIKA